MIEARKLTAMSFLLITLISLGFCKGIHDTNDTKWTENFIVKLDM